VEGLMSIPPAKYVMAPNADMPDDMTFFDVGGFLCLWIPAPDSDTSEILDAACNSRTKFSTWHLPVGGIMF
jgi:hypothetical protein